MKSIAALLFSAVALTATAQKIDLNMSGRQEQEVNEVGYQPWVTGRTVASTAQFTASDDSTITITLAADNEDQWLGSCWWKDACTKNNNKLLGDGTGVYGNPGDGNAPNLTTETAAATMTISGLTAGQHTLIVYMNTPEQVAGSAIAPVEIKINDTVVGSDFKQGARPTAISEGEFAFLSFNAEEGKDVVINFKTLTNGTEWKSSGLYFNALVFDRPNPKTQAADPVPANRDFHVDGDNGSINMTWTMASSAVKNHIMLGTSADDLKELAVTTAASYTLSGVTNLETYYWRIDEETKDGTVYQGETWTFRPRHLAFPGAEGYGRFATGGRGGSVYHVTTLEDNGDDENPIPGSFRYGVKKATGPRTIVFDVSGTIYLKARLFCSDNYVTIAGQTAPQGLLLRGAPFGISSESQCRFLRMRRGFHNDDENDYSRGLDGLGINGDHAIMDHCSISWTIDEAHSSRNAKNITFQNNFISEALNDAHHPNYSWGTKHGYAATIGGETSSYHHNLLAHNEGRNWSISGGLAGNGDYAGRHDMFNNVCYNWGGRATDGGTHEGQFVNNYYIMGPATSQKYLLNAQIEGTGTGSQAYYVSGNIREERSGSLTQDKQGETYKYTLSGGQQLDWDVFTSEPFFPSYATIDPAKLAYKKVISDAGVNYEGLDKHDTRVMNDVTNRTYTYTGSSTGKKGLIDREWDAEGYNDEEFPEQHRDTAEDTDQDGMPNWWENITGTDPYVADNNHDEDGDGYTALENYLNFLATPHRIMQLPVRDGSVAASTTIPHTDLFRGFKTLPTVVSAPEGITVTVQQNGDNTTPNNLGAVSIEVAKNCPLGVYPVVLEANDNDNIGSMQRTVSIAVIGNGEDSGINENTSACPTHSAANQYNLAGQRVAPDFKGITIKNGVKVITH